MKNKLVPKKKHEGALGFRRDEYPFDLLHREIDELFDFYYRGLGNTDRRFTAEPGFEFSETDEEYRVKAELPGMDEKDIDVSIDENMLTIRAERKDEYEENKRNYHVSEMSYGSVLRNIPLPEAVNRDQATAKFKRGVLTLMIPKQEKDQADVKKVPISAW